MDSLLPKRRDLPTRPAGKELLVREPDESRVHFLNASASIVWECCDGNTSYDQCIARLRTAFPIPDGADLVSDIRAALDDLSERRLLEVDL
jgi:hypothetical protein